MRSARGGRWRALLPDVHGDLLRVVDATSSFVTITPEGYRGRDFTHLDATSPLEFFDLRVASPCELLSPREYPPPGLLDAVLPCP